MCLSDDDGLKRIDSLLKSKYTAKDMRTLGFEDSDGKRLLLLNRVFRVGDQTGQYLDIEPDLRHAPRIISESGGSFPRPDPPGAGAWLTATPASRDTHIPSPLFRVALQRRLRMPVWDCDAACGLCGIVGVAVPFVVVAGSLSSLQFPPNWRSAASWSLPGPVTSVAPALAPTSPPVPTSPLMEASPRRHLGSLGSVRPR